MTAFFLTIVLDSLFACILWLVIGSRLTLAEETKANDFMNLLAYIAIGLPFVFVIVFYLLEHL